MALLIDGMKCPICAKPIDINKDEIFATSGVFINTTNSLWKFCDAAMHWDCYEHWPHRQEFAKLYFIAQIETEKQNPFWSKIYLDDDIFISANPDLPVNEVRIVVKATGSDIRVKLNEWDKWIFDQGYIDSDIHQIDKNIIGDKIYELSRRGIVTKNFKKLINKKANKQILRKIKKDEKKVKNKLIRQNKSINILALKMKRELQKKGLKCPHCKTISKNIRYINRAPTTKSFFICNECVRSFWPEINLHKKNDKDSKNV